MAVSLLIQSCGKSPTEDCGGSSHIPVDKGGGVNIEVFTFLTLSLLLMQDIYLPVFKTGFISKRAQIISHDCAPYLDHFSLLRAQTVFKSKYFKWLLKVRWF